MIAIAQITKRNPWIDTTVPPYLWIFLLGAAARLSWEKIGWAFKGTFPIWLTFHLILWIGPTYKTPTPAVILSIITLAGCVLSFAHTLPSLSKALEGADVSYGIYLYHMPVIMVFMSLGYKSQGWLWGAVFLCTFAAGAVSWLLIEKRAPKKTTGTSARLNLKTIGQ
jgi:peptidoglycan/LPS O-acetylase OafA/YrhL